MRKRTLQPTSKALPFIQAAFEQFQKQNQLKNLSQGTIDFYSSKARHFFNFLEGTDQPIDSITEETVVDYIFHLKEKQLHNTTINTYLRMVRAFLVPLTRALTKILEEYLVYREGSPSDLLFVSEYGVQLTVSALGNAVWAYNHKRVVEKTSVHLFRHTYAKLYIQAGGDPFRLQKLLGHSDLSMTRRYIALYADDLKANYDALNPLEQMTHNTRRDIKIKLAK